MTGLYCHSEYLGRKVTDINGFEWGKVNLMHVVGLEKCPEPEKSEIYVKLLIPSGK